MAVDTKDSDSVCSYINKNYQHIVSLYNKGEYEAVIAESDEFENDYKLQEILFPILVKCRNIADKCMSPKAKVHFRNERILRYFGWVDNIKYLTGAASLVFWYLLANNSKRTCLFLLPFSPSWIFSLDDSFCQYDFFNT